MLKNFSIPMSAPKPDSVTERVKKKYIYFLVHLILDFSHTNGDAALS